MRCLIFGASFQIPLFAFPFKYLLKLFVSTCYIPSVLFGVSLLTPFIFPSRPTLWSFLFLLIQLLGKCISFKSVWLLCAKNSFVGCRCWWTLLEKHGFWDFSAIPNVFLFLACVLVARKLLACILNWILHLVTFWDFFNEQRFSFNERQLTIAM